MSAPTAVPSNPITVPWPSHASVAWLLRGVLNTPGVLTLHRGRLSFRSGGGVVFDDPVTFESNVVFPWYYFGGGFKVSAGGKRRRISLMRPNNAPDVDRALLDLAGMGAGFFVADALDGHREARVWREMLEGVTGQGR